MEKINVAELLKDCPKGMELDCTLVDGVVFEKVDFNSSMFPIIIRKTGTNTTHFLTRYGQYVVGTGYKCVIFPKGKTTWEGFQRPFKDGDIVATSKGDYVFMLKKIIYYGSKNIHDGRCYFGVGLKTRTFLAQEDNWFFSRLATEEEKHKLFEAIKEIGYKWNEETKTLEKLADPKFKVGDYIRHNKKNIVRLVSEVCDNYYLLDEKDIPLPFFAQDDWELVPNKFDITTLVPFESKVLVREGKTDVWQPSYYGFLNQRNKRFYTTTNTWLMCIPYNEDTKHLIGTTNDCDEYYKTWEERA